MAGHGLPDPLDRGQHGGRPARAVQAHHVGAGVLQAPAGLVHRRALADDPRLMHGERHHGWLARALDDLER
jgi:hypothetical protein